MAVEDATDVATMFDLNEHAVTATYTPAVGSPGAVNVIRSRPIEATEAPRGEVRAVAEKIQVADMSVTGGLPVAVPRRGDTVTIGAVSYRVRRVDQDVSGLVFTLDIDQV